jgi:TP901 family phage tail tape measure protein
MKIASLAVLGIGAASVKSAVDFQASMTKIRTQAGASAGSVKALSGQVLSLAMSSQQGPTQLADALFHLKSLGMDNVQAMHALKTASDLAAVGGANLESVTNAVGGAWRSGVKGAGDFGRAAATVNAIIGAGNMKMQDFTSSLNSGVLMTAKTFGVGLKQVGAAMALMTDEGVPAAEAGSNLKMSLSLLGAPSATAAKQLAQIGISSTALASRMRSGGLIGAIGMLRQHIKASGLSAVQASQLLSRSFGGGRTGAAIMGMINQFSVMKTKLADINHGTRKFGADVKAQSRTAAAQFAMVRSKIEVVGVKIGTALLPAVNGALKLVSKLASWFGHLSPHARTLVLEIVGIGAALMGGVLIASKVVSAFRTVSEAVTAVKDSQMIAAVASKVWAAAQWLLNAALDANPIGLIVIALALLIAGLVLAYKHSATFRRIVQDAFHGVEAVVKAVVGWFEHSFVPFFTKTIPHVFDLVLQWVKAHWPLLVGLLTGPIGLIVAEIIQHWKTIVSWTERLYHDVVGWIEKIPSEVRRLFADAGTWLLDAGKHIIEGLINGVKSMIGGVAHIASDVADTIKSFFPFSPAKQGPLSGRGDPYYSGISIASKLARGISDSAGTLEAAASGGAAAIVKGLTAKGGKHAAAMRVAHVLSGTSGGAAARAGSTAAAPDWAALGSWLNSTVMSGGIDHGALSLGSLGGGDVGGAVRLHGVTPASAPGQPASGPRVERLLEQMLAEIRSQPGRTAAGLSSALNGVTRDAVVRSHL